MTLSGPTKPIDPLFYSYDTGEPFTNCIMCNKHLLHPGTSYIIEKAYKRYPALDTEAVIFEYAICIDCADKMRKELSEESKISINNYFQQHFDFESRYERMMKLKFDINEWLSECAIKKTDLKENDEYMICAQCDGSKMVFNHFPYMVGGDAMEEISNLISQKTRDVLDGFIDRHLSGPPELKELFKSNKKLLLV